MHYVKFTESVNKNIFYICNISIINILTSRIFTLS